jgi:hypothetical protein
MAGRPFKCPYCSQTKTIWKGYRPLKIGKVRLRQCRECGKKFTTKHHLPDNTPPDKPPYRPAQTVEELENEQQLYETGA